ncbi:hypothetical protein QTP86_032609 [Hemibagrus guttatus]|nr:hypothetical protein QTP86_032609 [Hemibagrus guttatus]
MSFGWPGNASWSLRKSWRKCLGRGRIEGRECRGSPIFTEEQERAIINMVLANNAIRLRDIQTNILNDYTVFSNVHQVSLTTLARILKKHHFPMKQLYRVPFERNSKRVKDLRHEYVENVMCFTYMYLMHSSMTICVQDIAVFVTICVQDIAIYLSTDLLLSKTGFMIIHSFHSNTSHHTLLSSTPLKSFFSAWLWKVYDLQPYVRIPLIQAMEEACDLIDAGSVQGWIRHSRRFCPRCLVREDIACDVDEVLWQDPARRRDA